MIGKTLLKRRIDLLLLVAALLAATANPSCRLHTFKGGEGAKGGYFDIETGSAHIKKNNFNVLDVSVYIIKGSDWQKKFEKQIEGPATSYVFPSNFFDTLKTQELTMFLYTHPRNGYKIVIKPADWKEKKKVYGQYSTS